MDRAAASSLLIPALVAGALAIPRADAASSTYFESGNELHTRCSSTGAFDLGFCFGFIVSMADTLMANRPYGWSACIPVGGTSQGQIVDVVKQFLAANPKTRHLSAASLVALALAEAFPCKP